MSTVNAPAEQRVIFYDVSWETYLALAAENNRPGKRISFDQGVMEIMSPGMLHENAGRLIGRMVEVFTMELNIEATAVKSTTFRGTHHQQGFEADESFYIANERAIRGKDHVDLAIDPPPDLVIEIDISRTSMNKFAIYGSLKVPEVWIYDGESLVVYIHAHGEKYDIVNQSFALPQFPLAEASRCLDHRHEFSQTELVRSFRDYIRQRTQE